jgi:hypothetical protein
MHSNKSLAQAMRDRADFLRDKTSAWLEYGWGETSDVVAALYEFADVVDSWSGEYLSKELTHQENERRRYGLTPTKEDMTMEERIAAVKK